MAEFKLGRIRFVWKGEWNSGNEYYKDDVVSFNGKSFICVIGHTSAEDFSDDFNITPSKWNLVAEGQSWRGGWQPNTEYFVDNIVKWGARLYICDTPHTSSTVTGSQTFTVTVETNTESPGNNVFAIDGVQYPDLQFIRGYTYTFNQDDSSNTAHPLLFSTQKNGTHSGGTAFETGVSYFLDGVEVADGDAYNAGFNTATQRRVEIAVSADTPDPLYYYCYNHSNMAVNAEIDVTSYGLTSDISKWKIFAEGLEWKGEWQTEFDYKINDFVKYGGSSYVCISDHVSSSTSALGLESDIDKWETFNNGFDFQNSWQSNYRYKLNDVVRRGGKLWICVVHHTSSSEFASDSSNWQPFVEGFEFESEWDAYKNYQIGDIVVYGGNQYIARADNIGEFPTTSNSWEVFSEGLKFVGDWNEDSSQVEYRVGNVVRLGGFTYRCIKDHTNQQPPNEEFWIRLNSGFEWRSEWAAGAEYYQGDVVRFGDNSYVANTYHIADDGVNSPDLQDSSAFWSVISIGSEQSVLTTEGDLLYFAGSVPARLPIGDNGQILTVSPEGIPEWEFLGASEDVYYVAEHGENEPAPIYGKSIDRPWKSIRYACEQIEYGTKNPQARMLLENNRVFIQKETIEWAEYQSENNLSPFTDTFTFDSAKWEREIGFILDSIVWDISHGGNVRSRDIALKYINDSNEIFTPDEQEEFVAAVNYSLTLISDILDQTDPEENYQILRGDNSTRIAEQYTNMSLTAEDSAFNDVSDRVAIITTAISEQDENSLPKRNELHTLVKVSTGKYFETCPIIVPALCCVLGDELRSTRIEARNTTNSNLVAREDFIYKASIFNRLENVISDIVDGQTVSASSGNTQTQYQEWPFAETANVSPAIERLVRSVRRHADFKLGSKEEITLKPHYDMSSPLLGRGRDLLQLNKEFLKAEVVAYIGNDYSFRYSRTKAKEDTSYIIDAVSYDLTYEGNWQSVIAGEAYYDGTNLGIGNEDKQALIDTYNFLNNLARDVATDTEVTALQDNVEQIRGIGGDTNVATRIDSLLTDIVDIVDNGTGTVATVYPTINTTEGQAVVDDIDTAKSQIEDDSITFINTNFPNLEYDQAKCERDIGLILEAVSYDAALDTNFATCIAAYAYLRQSGEKVLKEQKEASIANFEFVKQRTLQEIPLDPDYTFARDSIDDSFEFIADIVYTGEAEGSNNQVEDQEIYHAIHQIRLNKDFITKEAYSYFEDYYTRDIVEIDTNANVVVIDSTEPLELYTEVVMTNNLETADEQDRYFVYDIVSDTEFKITDSIGGSEVSVVNVSDAIVVQASYEIEETELNRYVEDLLDDIIWDLTYPSKWQRDYTGTAGVSDFTLWIPGSYKHRLNARYYSNEIIGSQEEDMYYVRNATGLRLQTVGGLLGDLGPTNQYGTRRPTAGAYASLDPGWGPNDERVWITQRSPYVQNVSTFGRGAIGQKIDGELHAGGNDSIVSNDFTQLISDGIGAWITNNGRAELVSVFTYYAHIGYLAEEGGRVRATNGNNSYGTFGSVAEGVDPEETPITAVIDNRGQFQATVSNVYTDGEQLLSLEYENAGINYTEAEIDIFGAGSDADIVVDEFRDDSVFQVIIDEDEDTPAGGEGYTLQSNTAQSGSTTGIFLAATDGRLSSAYIGMAIYIIGGRARGQYAYIDTYNAGTKEATVVKEDGTAGWEHIVPGTEIVNPNSTSTYQIEPRVEIESPTANISNGNTLDSAVDLAAIDYFETSEEYFDISASGGTGSGVSFDVIRIGSKYYVTLNSAGSGYQRLETLTILGSELGGADSTNDITIRPISLDEDGAIIEFDFSGYGEKGLFVGVSSDPSATAHTSIDGKTWTTENMSTSDPWSDIASGLIDDGSSIFQTSIIAAISTNGTVNYSINGIDWFDRSTGLSSSGVKKIAFGKIAVDNNRFVTISDNSTDVAYSVNDAENWNIVPNGLPATGYSCITYGKGLFVAARSGAAEVSYSTDGETWTTTTDVAISANWVDIKWGNGRFILIAADGTILYSLDGETWLDTESTGLTTPLGQLAYGQGVFVITSTADNSAIYHSEFGLEWSSLTVGTTTASGYNAIAHGNPDRTTSFVASSAGIEDTIAYTNIGARARARAGVSNDQIFELRLLEPGSYYQSSPTITVTDPNNITDVLLQPRLGNGSLANPSYLNRGQGYSEASAELNEQTSNGEADFRQSVDQIAVKWITERPVDGSNVEFDSLPGKFFKLVNTLSFVGEADGSYTAFLQISPGLTITEAPPHEDPMTLRIRYSQVRLTGHDFLDIGTGSQEETNYPSRVFGEPENLPDQSLETTESDGGRVFFTSTDQDGNFRVGNLFSVEQSTGVATISADAFNLAGLQELSLGEVTLGGNSATVNEFSTDPFFTADSDNIVPTQRAVKSYIEAQIGGGGASINVNSVTAGDIFVGSNQISSVTGEPINITGPIRFQKAVLGLPIAFQYFLR